MKATKFYLLCSMAALVIAMPGCIKKSSASDSEICDINRTTILVATDLVGQVGYNKEMAKWVINVSIPGTYDGVRTCIVCGDIPGDLKIQGLSVVFSGDLKDSNGYPRPQLGGQEIYYVRPAEIKKL